MAIETFGFTYHCHTFRCGHAFGEDEEFVLAALEHGYEVLGFSDHIMLPGIYDPHMRGDISMQPDYFASIKALKKKYEGKIELHIGYEAEWMNGHFKEHYENLLDSGDVEYLILGNHCFFQEGRCFFYPNFVDKDEMLKVYTDHVVEGMRSGLFLYFAHPDFPYRWRHIWDPLAEECARRIIETAMECNVPLEVNMGPARWWNLEDPDRWDNLPYPFLPFWKLVGEYGATCIMGVDAHKPKELYENDFGKFREFIKRCNLKMVDRLNMDYRKVAGKKKH